MLQKLEYTQNMCGFYNMEIRPSLFVDEFIYIPQEQLII
jgi:hypothetical protein